jgi:scyllo-inositol 2-dehydrogenase (NADP+)
LPAKDNFALTLDLNQNRIHSGCLADLADNGFRQAGFDEMENRNFQLVIVGYGGMGHYHKQLIDKVTGLHVHGIYDILPEVRDKAAREGILAYDSLEQVLADPEVQIVLVATPNHVHKEISLAALEAGKHVICEKPVALSSADLQMMIDAAEKNRRLFVVHQNRRWDEDYQMVRRLVEDKSLGSVYRIEHRVMGSHGIPGDWRKYKEFGGGMLYDWGIHLLDQILDLVKDPLRTVYCELSFIEGFDCDDGFRASLHFAGGLTALMEVQTWNFIALPQWYVNGTCGTAVIDKWGKEAYLQRTASFDKNDIAPIVTAAGLTKTMAPLPEKSIIREEIPLVKMDGCEYYRNVMDAIDGRCLPIVRNDQVLRVLRLVEACFESARTRQVVAFDS